ncbi:MAG: metallophosphoesterase family protein, partial [Acidimicrobiales bacterium]
MHRRQFAKLMGLGGAAFASGLFPTLTASRADAATRTAASDFFFVQLSDSHWGFKGDAVNPEAMTTLPKAVAAVNSLPKQPDFIIFTGDLTHTTDDAQERRKRMTEFRAIVKDLKVKNVRFIPGENDAS